MRQSSPCWIALLAAGFVGAGCSWLQDPEIPVELVLVDTPTVVAFESLYGVQGAKGEFAFHVINAGPDVFLYDRCSIRLERWVEDDWVLVWAPSCQLIGTDPLRIEAGERHADAFSFSQAFGSDGRAWGWFPPIEGVYRVSYALHRGRSISSEPFGVSP